MFVHAGLDVNKSLEQQEKDDFVWSRSEWYCNADQYKDYNVVFGHTVVQCIINDKHCNDVVKIGQHFAIDTGCVFYGTMTFMIIDGSNIYFQKVLK